MITHPHNGRIKPSSYTTLMVVGALLVLLALSCSKAAPQVQGVPGASNSRVPKHFSIEASISHLPKLNEPFTVTGKFTAIKQDEDDAELWIGATGRINAAAAYLDGEDRWHGPLKLGEEKILSATYVLLREGDYVVGAGAYSPASNVREVELPQIEITATADSSFYQTDSTRSRASIALEGQIPSGQSIVVDQTLLLNTGPNPRIEFIQSKDDVLRLQQEGLLPAELRYGWRNLSTMDFSKRFLIAYYDRMRPQPGHAVVFEGTRLFWKDGGFKVNYKTYSAPPEISRADRPVSPIVVRSLARTDKPFGFDLFAFQGDRRFEFAIDSGTPIVKQVDLIPQPKATPTPP